MRKPITVACLLVLAIAMPGCQINKPKAAQPLERKGDEIVIAGQYFHTGAPVVLWTDPGGYDAYRTERRFVPWEQASFERTAREVKDVDSPSRYGIRFAPRSASTAPTTAATTQPAGRRLTPEQFEQVRGGGWPLDLMQEKVDQFVYHYDVAANSRGCFRILHDIRGLSVHFMLDHDGTIYQTLDVKERAFHATKANDRSVGIEIANIGAYPLNSKTLDEWYRKDEKGKVRLVLPAWATKTGGEPWRTPNFVARPARQEAVIGNVQGRDYRMYDLTPQQYDSLIKLTAALCSALPNLKCDYPRDENGKLITRALSDEQWQSYKGLLGHFHVQTNKQDPGPAFQWDKVINGARKRMGLKPLPPGDIINNPKARSQEAQIARQ